MPSPTAPALVSMLSADEVRSLLERWRRTKSTVLIVAHLLRRCTGSYPMQVLEVSDESAIFGVEGSELTRFELVLADAVFEYANPRDFPRTDFARALPMNSAMRCAFPDDFSCLLIEIKGEGATRH